MSKNELKREIREIEAEIFAITGKNNEIYNHWADDEEKRNRVIELLKRRQFIIEDDIFPVSADENERLWSINEKLYEMTMSTWQRAVTHGLNVMHHYPYEEDFMVECQLRYVYDGEDSVLKLDEDSEYGSNFALIIKVITELYVAERQENIIDVRYDSEELFVDDETNSSEIQFWKLKESYMDVTICHATHNLVNCKLYSPADLIRLNNFKQDVQVTYRYTYRQSHD